MAFLRKNFAFGTLAGNITDVAVQLTMTVGHKLPTAVGTFRLTIWDNASFPDPADDTNLEIVTAGYSGVPNIYDITRAQESTLAVAHSSGDKVALHYTAGMSEDDLTDAVVTHEAAFAHVDIALNTTHRGLVVGNPHNVTVGDIGASSTTHRHDGETLEHDAVNSDGGAFSFTTTGLVTFNQSFKSANYEASNKLTACATNAGALDFSAASKTLTVEDSAIVSQDYSSDASPTWAGATIGSVVIPGVYTATEEPTGFVDQVATLSWNDGTHTLTITGNHDIYQNGVKTTKTTDSIQIGDVTGLHWVYYNAAGVLSEQIGAPGFDLPLMATVYWNTTPGYDKGLAGEERHGIKMDAITHGYLHYTVGSRYRSGLAGTFDNTTITIESGVWYDEDIEATPAQQTTCNVLYKNGSAAWEWDAGASVYYKLNGANLRYNNGNALADVTSNRYMAMWVFITNDISVPVVALMGQRQDVKLADARANNKYELLSLGDLPFEEMKLLYRVILRNTGAPPTYTEALDMRSVSNLSTGTYIATAHSTLTGLTTGDDHSQYLLADGTRILAGAWDMGSQALTNVNIDSGDINVAVVNTEWDAAYTHSQVGLGNPHSVTPTELSLVIGTNVQAWDTGLDSLAGLGYVADSMIKITAEDVYAIRTMSEVRTDLGLVIGTNVQAHGDVLDDLNTLGVVGGDNQVLIGTGAGVLAWESGDTLRTSIGLAIGTNVLAEQTIGIANDNLLEVDDADAAVNDYCKLTANGIVGRNYSEVLGDLSAQASAVFDLNGQDLINGGVLFLTEQADAEADVAAKGQFWVKTATPCEPYFTGDTGVDIQLGLNNKVGIDSAATAGYIGAASSDGVLRTGVGLAYADGGDFVTINTIDEGARVYREAAQTLTTGSHTAILFTHELWDTNTIHNVSSNTSRLTCKIAGKYTISGFVNFDINTTGYRWLYIKLNNTTDICDMGFMAAGAGYYSRVSLTTIYELSVDDYVELIAYQDSGGDLDVIAPGAYAGAPAFMMQRMA